jgi:hypothetical protein
MSPRRLFGNCLGFVLSSSDFDDHDADSTYRGAPIELAELSSAVPVYAGNFHVDVLGPFGLQGF